MLRWILSISFLLAMSTATVFAQAEIGGATLNGTVTDATGAAVPGAKVTVTNHDTGFSRTTTTNQAGQYTLPTLPVGSYDLTAENQGFKVSKRTGIALTVGAVATVDVVLEVGGVQETVRITAGARQVT